MQINKIKIKGGVIQIEWSSETDAGENAMTLVSRDAPQQSFYDAILGLAEHIVDALELPPKYADGLMPSGVTFKRKNGFMGATMSGSRKLTNGKTATINTPFAFEATGEEKDRSTCLKVNCVTALRKVEAEAVAFIRGERAQLAMFGESQEEKPARSRKAS